MGGSTPTIWLWSGVFVLGYAALVAAAGSRKDRRDRFWMRALLLPIIPAGLPVIVGLVRDTPVAALGPLFALVFVPSLMFVPVLLYRTTDSASEEDDEDDDGGGGGPPAPPRSPDPRPSGIPLADAEQSRARVRDHGGGRRRSAWRRPGHTRIRRERVQ